MVILILGGYGVFGGRLAELLSDAAKLELIICGRDRSRAEAFCAAYRGGGQRFGPSRSIAPISSSPFASNAPISS